MLRYASFIMVLSSAAYLAGCAAGRSVGANAVEFRQAQVGMQGDNVAQAEEYVIRTGDVLDVKFFYDPNLNERIVVRPDGRISLQLVDEIKAAGMRPSELAGLLKVKYSRVLLKPEVTVIVREFSGQRVYVGGEVNSPKLVVLGGELTALQAIMDAGGFKETANPGSIIVISKGPDNRPVARRVDLDGNLKGDVSAGDVLLRPFDVVFVPKTFIAEANKFVEKYIRNIIPVNLTAGFSYTLFRETNPPP